MQTKSEFCGNFKQQVTKLNNFLQTWAKAHKAATAEGKDPLSQVVIEFAPDQKRVIDYAEEFKDQAGYAEADYLANSVASVQRILWKLFFGPIPAPS